MGKIAHMLGLLLTHPTEFGTLVHFYLYHKAKRDITAPQEHPTSGWDRASMRRCWEFLDMTSRSFAVVIKELEGDLARTVCMFYLVLRGLDTIEDDMTIPDAVKQPLLRSFHEKTVTPGWNFTGNGPTEKDRQLLVEYDTVVEEVNRLAPEHRQIILDITHKMGVGMADYAHRAAMTGTVHFDTITEYDLYCHYSAGLVGEGLARICSASGKEAPLLREQLELANSMGLLLQKTNIIRDFREDTDDERFLWPREIWGKYGFEEMKDMCEGGDVEHATWAQSGMVLDALRHATGSLECLRLLTNQGIFVACAVPLTMAMATLTLCFMNPEVFQRSIKIRKAEAVRLVMRSTNLREVALIFREYAREIHHKARPQDPNFLRLSVVCGRMEQWFEQHYPSFVVLSQTGPTFDPRDKRTAIVNLEKTRLLELETKRGKPQAPQPIEMFPRMYVGGALLRVGALSAGIIYIVLAILG
ncbi:squalene synthase [Hygrophoropsis aurantiaca]|uniref:Squalene synthase n=1 Tax=Hygrophoropsis aurantiaca TaxID=72124 RepID=A0ACB7ZX94_9AGAM|nr:squalene synthase [Hygrophoropsis aurantiaca]